MRSAQDYELQGAYDLVDEPPPGAGWITFAAVMLGLAAIWNVVDGVLAITGSRVYAADARLAFGDLRTWGWIVLILGVLMGLAALSIATGSELARWFGIAAASLNAIGQLLFAPAYPWWAVAMFGVDLLIIYALAVYGGRRLRAGL